MMARRALASGVGVLCAVGSLFASLGAAPAFAQAPPAIEEQSVLDVAASSATLSARIDAHELETEYRFEYGPTNSYGQAVPVPSGSVAPEFAGGEVTAHVQGLQAHITYHYRVVASNSLGVVDGADQTFQTQGAVSGSTLPDGRQWEMVSPPQKRGAAIFGIGQGSAGGDQIQAAADGDALTYLTSAPTEADPQGYAVTEQLLSTRHSGGWESRAISPPHSEATGLAEGAEYRLFSPDLSQGIVQPFGPFEPALSAEASEQTAYLRTIYPSGDVEAPCTSSCYRPLVTGKAPYANVPPGTEFGRYPVQFPCNPKFKCGPQFLGATPDLSHVVLESEAVLTSTPAVAEPEGGYLYEWSAGKLAPVSVLPDGELGQEASLGSLQSRNVRHAISDDGSRVVWYQEHGKEAGLYLRDTVKGQTVEIAPEYNGASSPSFQTASSDGSKIFFTAFARMTADSGAAYEAPDLYECEVVEMAGVLQCNLSDLTPLGPSGESAGVQGRVLGASEDGSYVYFVANGVLAPGAVPGQCTEGQSEAAPAPGATCNLYVYHDGATKLVAVVSGEDWLDWSRGSTMYYTLDELSARVSPDGQWLAFMSDRELTGYDNRDAISGERDEEVFLYNAQAGRLVCASCNPTGARPVGAADRRGLVDGEGNHEGQWLAASIPTWTAYAFGAFGRADYQSRFLSDSGRLFFNSHDALVPQDVNGTWDVYEYEPPDVGNCETSSAMFGERSDGCVGLISSGSSAEESAFLDASESGGDVFMLTAAKLSAQDTDSALDIYDAHECSAVSPCPAPPAVQPPPCSTGDSCKAAPTPQPAIFGSPASATFSGAGNVSPASAPVVVSKDVTPKSSTRAARLAKALKACRGKPKRERAGCERRARARYAKQARRANAKRGSRG
jgi:hypothetical protein